MWAEVHATLVLGVVPGWGNAPFHLREAERQVLVPDAEAPTIFPVARRGKYPSVCCEALEGHVQPEVVEQSGATRTKVTALASHTITPAEKEEAETLTYAF